MEKFTLKQERPESDDIGFLKEKAAQWRDASLPGSKEEVARDIITELERISMPRPSNDFLDDIGLTADEFRSIQDAVEDSSESE